MQKKPGRKPISIQARLLCELLVGIVIFSLPFPTTTRVVLAFIATLLAGIALISFRLNRFTPWELAGFQSPDRKLAFLESLFYTIGGFGLLIYLASSEHEPFHFALGFFGIICVWLLIQLIYCQQYALQYYRDGGGLAFPDCSRPHWTEFLYQGFCMAACYQTSDTAVTSTAMRQLIATHGILSYILSVSIIGMMFGLVANIL
ncbi:DUF1345 domain-containing protein [Pannus brasiliensis CCIBt3594]|uniref:DUF1345 domain-containing protein n=1 Tax=Pannus brasiliensis CCIBt3594 TaxID=1427578 RepID=A0AAW9QYB1_9CHRO